MNGIWVVKAIEDRPEWKPRYDKAFGFVVAAHDESAARIIASENAGDEKAASWLNVEASTAVCIGETYEGGLIMVDFHAA